MITSDIEQVEVKFDKAQNDGLSLSFKAFYKLDSAPSVTKALIVDKAVYNRFLKSRTKIRTQFEAKDSEIDLSFDAGRIPFEFIATRTEFLMPSGKVMTLFEELDAPNGLTKRVVATYGEDVQTFDSYFKAEAHVLAIFLAEKGNNGQL